MSPPEQIASVERFLASAFTLVGYVFSGSFASAGEAATRVTLAVVVVGVAVFVLVGRRRARAAPSTP